MKIIIKIWIYLEMVQLVCLTEFWNWKRPLHPRMTSNWLITPRQHANSVWSDADKPVTVTNRLTLSQQCSQLQGRRDWKQPDKSMSRSSELFTRLVKGCARSVAVRCRWRCQSCKRTGGTQSTKTSQAHPWRPDTQTHSFPAAAWDCGIHVALFPQVITLITLEHAVCFILSGDFELSFNDKEYCTFVKS